MGLLIRFVSIDLSRVESTNSRALGIPPAVKQTFGNIIGPWFGKTGV